MQSTKQKDEDGREKAHIIRPLSLKICMTAQYTTWLYIYQYMYIYIYKNIQVEIMVC